MEEPVLRLPEVPGVSTTDRAKESVLDNVTQSDSFLVPLSHIPSEAQYNSAPAVDNRRELCYN